jgi:hypothetical protein
MALKYGNATVQNYIFDCGKKYTVSNYKLNDATVYNNFDTSTPTDNSYFTFTLLDDDTYSIAAKDVTNIPAGVVLPSTYNGKAVTSVAFSGFFKCSTLIEIVIPDGIISIGGVAFADCHNLATVTILGSITTIGASAFANCSSLTKIVIPDSVTTIGSSAFYNCSSLTIYCEASSQPSGWNTVWNSSYRPVIWGYYEPTDESYFTFTEQTDGTYSIKAADVSNLPSEVGIPSTYNGKAVTAIDESAFYSATINKVVIPEGVTRIGNGAFDNCKRLLNVSLPSTLTEIGGWAFRDCTALTSIVIPIGVTTIGTWAFLRDMSLTINCEASSQPSGWHTDWNLSGGTVVWGYTG